MRHALVLEMDQELGQPALDRFEMVETGVGGVELLDQLGDPILEMAERRLVAAVELNALDLVDQAGDHGLELARDVLAVSIARFQRVRERGDPTLEAREHVAAAAVVAAWSTLSASERTSSESFASASFEATCETMPRIATIAPSSCLSAAGSWLLPAMRSILRESSFTASSNPTRFSAGVKRAQRIAHLGEPALDTGDRRAVGAGVTAVVDAIGELAHLAFERLDRLARHRLLQHDADLGEVVAQRVDRLADHAVDAARPAERLDLRVDLAKLALESRKAPGCGPAAAIRTASGRRRGGGGGRRRIAIERALAVGDLHQRLVERGGRIDGDGRTRLFAAEVGDHAVDRAHASLDLAGGGAPLGDQLVEPAVELGYRIGELARRLVVAAPGGLRLGRIEPRELVELPRELVEALIDFGDGRVGRGRARSSRLVGR